MTQHSKEVFKEDCPICDGTVQSVEELACPSCKIQIWHLGADDTAQRLEQATQYGIHRVPAMVVNSKLSGCCQN
ncbi:thioredoxin [Acaryochloris sp. CCMEE 5410]|uniref:thioredoxin n=1 Tax=Acaryochloris sp. CCMEE 5410 TaxID=310037 RepID=UPI00024843EA|nr:thioredoxin [Acaryochloris sp. CCMEE 5410]KAI9129920.1 glutaredoxin [Acaryochloris sp. CCMEE 5410]